MQSEAIDKANAAFQKQSAANEQDRQNLVSTMSVQDCDKFQLLCVVLSFWINNNISSSGFSKRINEEL